MKKMMKNLDKGCGRGNKSNLVSLGVRGRSRSSSSALSTGSILSFPTRTVPKVHICFALVAVETTMCLGLPLLAIFSLQ